MDWNKWRRLQRGNNGSLRPLKRSEEAQAPSRGKRSYLCKGTASDSQSTKFLNKQNRAPEIGARFCCIFKIKSQPFAAYE
ncbi:hypothetical protein FZC75_12065 [Sutcliffiella horikoshii]|uniref:Uncharacterized protein n=1 Tax=Sutcliffiella horikoshii TaxID=79883 RepID=A0A5D4TCP3_9BACI|nr:hypothetical protein FZC75_12065 [Sutcliffiella horikoshii]